jgi:hypothetical protein
LGIFADASVAGKLIDLARARQYGQARTQIVVNLSKTKDERVPFVLLGLLVRQPHLVMFEALSLVVASPGSGLV